MREGELPLEVVGESMEGFGGFGVLRTGRTDNRLEAGIGEAVLGEVGEVGAGMWVFKDEAPEMERRRGSRELAVGVVIATEWRFDFCPAALPVLPMEPFDDRSSAKWEVEVETGVGKESWGWERSIEASRVSSSCISCSMFFQWVWRSVWRRIISPLTVSRSCIPLLTIPRTRSMAEPMNISHVCIFHLEL